MPKALSSHTAILEFCEKAFPAPSTSCIKNTSSSSSPASASSSSATLAPCNEQSSLQATSAQIPPSQDLENRLTQIRLILSAPFASFPALHEALKRGSLNQKNLHDINKYLNQTPDFRISQSFIDNAKNYLIEKPHPEYIKIFYFSFFLGLYVNNYAIKKDYSWFSLLSELMLFSDELNEKIKTLTRVYAHRDTLSPEDHNVALHFFRMLDDFPWIEAILDVDANFNILPPHEKRILPPKVRSIDDFPDELKLEILRYLPFKTVAQMGALNKTWRRVTCDNLLWKRKIETDLPWLTVPENPKTDFLKTFKIHHETRNTDFPDFFEEDYDQTIVREIKRIFSIMMQGEECIEKFDELYHYFEKYPDLLTNYVYETRHYKNALMALLERKNTTLNKRFFLKIKEHLVTDNPRLLSLTLIKWMIALHAYENWDEEIEPYLTNRPTEQKNALYYALHYSNHEAVKKLFEFETLHCAIEVTTGKYIPLYLAAKFSDLRMIELLFQKGASKTVNIPDTVKSYPLHVAARRGNIAMIQKLLEAGAKVNVSDQCGWAPLMYLIRDARDAADPQGGIALLINEGAELNAIDDYGWNSVMLAVKRDPQAVQFLLDKSAKIDLRDNENKTALDITLDCYQKDLTKHNYRKQTQGLETIRLLLSHPFASFPALYEALQQGFLNQKNLHDINKYLNKTADFKIPQEFIDDLNNYLEKNSDPELKKIFYFVLFLSFYINNYASKKDHTSWFSLLSPLIKFVDGLDKEIKTLTQTHAHRDTLSPGDYNVALAFFRKFDNFPWIEALLDADAKFNILPANEKITLDLTLTNDDRMLTRLLISLLFKTHIMRTTLASREAHNFSLCDAAKKECLNKADMDSIHRFLDTNPNFKISDKFMQNLKNYLEKKNLSAEAKEILHFSLILCYDVNRYQKRREHHQVLFLRLDRLPQFFSRSEKLKAMEVWLTTPSSSGRNTLQTQYPALTHGKLKKTLSL